MQRIAFKLKTASELKIKKRHPWVFENSITKQSAEGQAGDLAIIYDTKKNKFLACGLYDPYSPIRIKVLQYHEALPIDKTWFENKIKAAYALRAPLLETKTNSYRLIYGENDGFPSLIADVYADVLVLKLYSAIWFPYFDDILPVLLEISHCKTLVLRMSRGLLQIESPWKDGQVLIGKLENENVLFKEHGLTFSANVVHGHKTGYFLDHRHNRLKIGKLARGKKVLDVFAYAGGFSVHALAGGAREVVSLDISKPALEAAMHNASLNPHNGTHRTIAADAFKGLDELIQNGELFDIVVIDPPSFAKQESEIPSAINSYKRLALLGAKLTQKGGLLVLASCTSRVNAEDFFNIMEESLRQSGRVFKLQEKTYHDVDHPIGFEEGAYLKCGYYLG